MDSVEKSKRLVIDTDAGVDDAQAILLALQDPSVHIEALTTVKGNASARQSALNVLRVLQVVGKEEKIPVYVGSEKPLLGVDADSTYYHGQDGLGDVPDPAAPGPHLLKAKHAVHALSEIFQRNSGELSLVCLGPLTNIALALRLDPQLGKKIKHCYIMGGNIYGMGNYSVAGEYNFAADPEAAQIVLVELECPISIVPWEPCKERGVPWPTVEKLRGQGGKFHDFMSKIEAFSARQSKEFDWEFLMADEWLISYVLDAGMAQEVTSLPVQVVCSAGAARGLMLVDWERRHPTPQQRDVTIVKKLNLDLMLQLLERSFKPSPPQ